MCDFYGDKPRTNWGLFGLFFGDFWGREVDPFPGIGYLYRSLANWTKNPLKPG